MPRRTSAIRKTNSAGKRSRIEPNHGHDHLQGHYLMRSRRMPASRLFPLSVLLSLCIIASIVFLMSFRSNAWWIGSYIYGPGTTRIYSIKVVNEYPHDPGAFTQGLLYAENNTLFESTGLYGRSSLRKVAVQTGKVEAIKKMDHSQFGEGLTLLRDRLYQVTWLTNIGFIYDRNNLSRYTKFTHQMKDGWGLATDGRVIFGSDGSSMLYQFDPDTMKVVRKHQVIYDGHEVHNLNELEFVNDEVWANVFQTDCIARISYKDGSVLGWIILPQLREGLLRAGEHHIDVLNGIAWDSESNRLFVTGKLWPKLYEVTVHTAENIRQQDVYNQCIRSPFRF